MGFLSFESTSQLVLCALVFVITWLIIARRRSKTIDPSLQLPPCLPSLPVIGSFPFIISRMEDMPRYFLELSKRHGDVFALYLGPRYVVVLNGIETIRDALLKKSSSFAGRTRPYSNIANAPDNGIIGAPYNDSFRRKHKLYLSILKELGFGHRVMEKRIHDEVNEFISQALKTKGQSFSPTNLVQRCVLNVIVGVLFGHRYSYEHPNLHNIQHLVHEVFAKLVIEVDYFHFLRFVPPFRSRFQAYQDLMGALVKAAEREIDIALNDNDDGASDSFVRLAYEAMMKDRTGKSSTTRKLNHDDREELIFTIRDLFVAGGDTSSVNLQLALILLANNPEAQSRMQKELDSVVGPDRLPSLDDEPNLPFSQAVLLETMRRYTAISLSVPRETTTDVQLGKLFIPAGTMVLTNLYGAHMDPEQWPEPEKFKPERFLDNEGQLKKTERVIPFSIGKRSCLGEPLARQSLFLFLSGIIHSFEVRPPEGHQKIDCDVKMNIVLEPEPFELRLIARKR